MRKAANCEQLNNLKTIINYDFMLLTSDWSALTDRAASIARKQSEEKGFLRPRSQACAAKRFQKSGGAGKRSDRAHALGDGGRVAEADNRPQR
jgi:hypothetical protein